MTIKEIPNEDKIATKSEVCFINTDNIPANFKSKELILLEQIANDISEIKRNISSLISYPIL